MRKPHLGLFLLPALLLSCRNDPVATDVVPGDALRAVHELLSDSFLDNLVAGLGDSSLSERWDAARQTLAAKTVDRGTARRAIAAASDELHLPADNTTARAYSDELLIRFTLGVALQRAMALLGEG